MPLMTDGVHEVFGVDFQPRTFKDSESYAIAIKCQNDNGETIIGNLFLLKKDGELIENNYKFATEVFGWDGKDPFWLADNAANLADKRFKITVERSTYKGKPSYQVAFFNRLNEDGGIKKADRNELTARFGAKFRAFSAAAPTPAPRPPQPPVSAPPQATSETADSCWAKMQELFPVKDSPEKLNNGWFSLMRHVSEITGTQQEFFGDAEWNMVMQEIVKAYGQH